MKRAILAVLVAILCAGLFAVIHAAGGSEQNRGVVRPAAAAGRFYPDSAEALKNVVEHYLADAVPRKVTRPLALFVPHAGYVFSGQIAADAFNQTEGGDYELIVILGTNHTRPYFQKVSVFTGRGFRTPLGVVEVDRKAASALVAADKDCVADEEVHATEHSIEVEVPFVQVHFPRARILPVIVASDQPALTAGLGEALAALLRNRRALIVCKLRSLPLSFGHRRGGRG